MPARQVLRNPLGYTLRTCLQQRQAGAYLDPLNTGLIQRSSLR